MWYLKIFFIAGVLTIAVCLICKYLFGEMDHFREFNEYCTRKIHEQYIVITPSIFGSMLATMPDRIQRSGNTIALFLRGQPVYSCFPGSTYMYSAGRNLDTWIYGHDYSEQKQMVDMYEDYRKQIKEAKEYRASVENDKSLEFYEKFRTDLDKSIAEISDEIVRLMEENNKIVEEIKNEQSSNDKHPPQVV